MKYLLISLLSISFLLSQTPARNTRTAKNEFSINYETKTINLPYTKIDDQQSTLYSSGRIWTCLLRPTPTTPAPSRLLLTKNTAYQMHTSYIFYIPKASPVDFYIVPLRHYRSRGIDFAENIVYLPKFDSGFDANLRNKANELKIWLINASNRDAYVTNVETFGVLKASNGFKINPIPAYPHFEDLGDK